MEDEKLERLHATLLKLAPKGKVGGLGFAARAGKNNVRDPTLPDNPLYRNFVRAGSGLGQYHKKDFDSDSSDSDAEKERKERRRKEKKEKKRKQSIEDEEAQEVRLLSITNYLFQMLCLTFCLLGR